MGKPKNAKNVKAGDSVILKRRKGKDPIVLNAFHDSEDPSKILKVVDVDRSFSRSYPTARVKVKSKNNNHWNENFWQILALEDLLKV